MTGVLFVQNDWLDHLGPLYLSAYLKVKNISTNVFITASPARLIEEVNRLQPELIAMSVASAGHQSALELLEKAKSGLKPPIVLGGPHPTFFPETLSNPAIDYILRGEGEESLYQLVLALRNKTSLDQVAALGYKKDGELKFNPPSRLVENLDSLPFPDRSLYFRYGYYRRLRMQRVITCRGCPYNCGYCFNSSLKEFYRGLGKYVRQRSPQNVIEELKSIKSFTDTVNFVDDSFGLNRNFADEFLDRFTSEIKLPFIVNLRPEQVDGGFAQKLSEAGCYCAQVGIESGNDQLREQLLGKKVSKEQIISAVSYLKERRIKVLSYNMLGLPGETLEQGLDTIHLNRELKIDFPRFSIFQPYPGTALGEEVVRRGLATKEDLMKGLSGSYFHNSPLKMPERGSLQNLQKLFAPAIKYPGLESAIKNLVKLPLGPLFEMVFLLTMASQYRKATNRSFSETIAYGLKNLSLFFE